MNLIRLLVFTLLVAVLTASSSGIGVSNAQQDPSAPKLTDEQIAGIAQQKAEAAVKAREKRDAAIKQRHATKEYMKKVIEGQNPGGTPREPVDAGTGGAK